MQIMPFWIKEIGQPGDNLFVPEINIRYGTSILKYYLDLERGNTVRALARYNGSAGSFVYPQRVYSALRTRWFQQ
jgi:soluble lytic murein transglycosylase-like protein